MSGAAGPVSGAATVTVEVFSDVVCPWCLIGRARLERAVAAFTAAEGAPAVDVVYRSFLLEPDAPRDRDGSMTEHLVERMGVGPDVVGRMMDRVAGIAAGEGLDVDLSRVRAISSFDAHRVLRLAHDRGLGRPVKAALMHAHFVEARHLGRAEELTEVAVGAGLDAAEVEAVLAGDAYADAVAADVAAAAAAGVSGVPHFMLAGPGLPPGERLEVSGAQEAAVLEAALGTAAGPRG
jgi:predicted DsbA family dithiol-disulfide isomerase